MSKRLEVILAVIALGLLLNAAVGFYEILRPAPAVAQEGVTDVNIRLIGGKPFDVYQWDDGTASPRVVIDRAIGGSEESPLFVKMIPGGAASP
jgi:hypothetical protein